MVRADNGERMLEVFWQPDGEMRQVCAFDIDEHQGKFILIEVDYIRFYLDYKHIRIGELVVYSNTEAVDAIHKGVSGVGMVHSVSDRGLLNVKWTDGTLTQVPPGHVISEHLLFGDHFDHGDENLDDQENMDDLDQDDWESCDSDR